MVDKIKVVIWDFDGTIVDSERSHWRTFNYVLDEENLPPLTWEIYLATALPMDDEELCRRALDQSGREVSSTVIDEMVRRKQEHFKNEQSHLQPYPGVIDQIQGLADNCVLAIATSAFREEVIFFLERLGIVGIFDPIVSATDVVNLKPNPECFLKALCLINSGRPEEIFSGECLVIEDSPDGVTAAKAAGMQCLGVTNTSESSALIDAGANGVVRTLENCDILGCI